MRGCRSSEPRITAWTSRRGYRVWALNAMRRPSATTRSMADVLPKLTAEDLRDLGVTLDRSSPQAARRDRRAWRGDAHPGGSIGAARDVCCSRCSTADAERRQLTVMFCDLVGSTALSTRHDPEDLRELIGDYHRAVAETVGRFDGFVAKYMGDGVLIYFGYPQAHEDDAERAVRAGLAVIEAVGRLPARRGFERAARHRHRARRGRRSDRRGRRTGARGRRRDAEPRRPAAGARHAEHAGHRRGDAPADRRAVRPRRSRAAGARRLCRAATGVAGHWRKRHVEPLRGVALGGDAARRPRRGSRAAGPPLATGEERRRTGGADLRRAGHRQVAAHGRTFRAHRNRAPYPPALFLLAASPGQRALSLHRPARTRRRVRPRRHGRSQARQTAGIARAGHAG